MTFTEDEKNALSIISLDYQKDIVCLLSKSDVEKYQNIIKLEAKATD